MPPLESSLRLGGREIPVSNLDKVLYPAAGFTKGQVLDYYIRISSVLLPHLKDRPLTLKRYPNGVAAEFFYEKRCPPRRPRWISTASIAARRDDGEINFCLVNDLPSLIWAANLASLELHTYLARAKSFDSPTLAVFDLDPGPPANLVHCARTALLLKERLDALRLKSFAKTSGSKGLQVCVPLNTPARYDTTKSFAKSLAVELECERPDLILSKMTKRLRAGKVFVDWSQNDRHKTTVCVYSLRAREQPSVSTPLLWEEVEAAAKSSDPRRFVFLAGQALERADRFGDLFAPVLKLKQRLPAAAARPLKRAARSARQE